MEKDKNIDSSPYDSLASKSGPQNQDIPQLVVNIRRRLLVDNAGTTVITPPVSQFMAIYSSYERPPTAEEYYDECKRLVEMNPDQRAEYINNLLEPDKEAHSWEEEGSKDSDHSDDSEDQECDKDMPVGISQPTGWRKTPDPIGSGSEADDGRSTADSQPESEVLSIDVHDSLSLSENGRMMAGADKSGPSSVPLTAGNKRYPTRHSSLLEKGVNKISLTTKTKPKTKTKGGVSKSSSSKAKSPVKTPAQSASTKTTERKRLSPKDISGILAATGEKEPSFVRPRTPPSLRQKSQAVKDRLGPRVTKGLPKNITSDELDIMQSDSISKGMMMSDDRWSDLDYYTQMKLLLLQENNLFRKNTIRC